MAGKNYYDILGVSKSANEDEIKKAYKRMAIKYHPDRNPGDKAAEEKFKEAAEAYDVLHDPQKRQVYDQFGEEGLKGGGFSTGQGMNMDDIFSMFGSMRFRRLQWFRWFRRRYGVARCDFPRQGPAPTC